MLEPLTPAPRTACVITVGDELLRGEIADTNGTEASRRLTAHGIATRSRHTVADDRQDISDAVGHGLGQAWLVLVIGGLGPTSDDVTRYAVGHALGLDMEDREEAWDAVCRRLADLRIDVHPDNRRQAQFPSGSVLLPNAHGTAWGATVTVGGRHVVLLPGPPKECLPMLDVALAGVGARPTATADPRWRTMGLPEPEVAARVDAVLKATPGARATAGYCWRYPYVDVTLHGGAERPDTAAALPGLVEEALAGHVVGRDGRSAGERLADRVTAARGDSAAGGPVGLTIEDSLSCGRFQQWYEGLAPRADGGPAGGISVTATGTWHTGSPTDHRGSVAMRCRVAVGETVHTYRLDEPNLGPEVLDGAAEFIAWSVLRALDAEPASGA
ncbi:competence/damage-inducible protein A [Streptomyces alboflavus]|uniref:competence/damage-inducible protein A n=1 Tax=Streptomyces alboflavus TaxID=67267 RepID=UPI0004C29D25|nr:competence/damage-inducible protein A [Streptomyces alboflavus]